jgi:putative transposase
MGKGCRNRCRGAAPAGRGDWGGGGLVLAPARIPRHPIAPGPYGGTMRVGKVLRGHDYRYGQYFVTICAARRGPIFEIPELRTILTETWQTLPQRFAGVTLDEFIIMPDHVHFILMLNGLVQPAPTLGKVIGAYKSLTTVAWYTFLKEHNDWWPGPIWQTNYYECIIRDVRELENERQYIRENPLRQRLRQAGIEPPSHHN